MRNINPPQPTRQLPARASGAVATDDRASGDRPRRQLIAEAVIASYIHDISVRHSPDAQETRFRVRT